jgi:hypothetical protein
VPGAVKKAVVVAALAVPKVTLGVGPLARDQVSVPGFRPVPIFVVPVFVS